MHDKIAEALRNAKEIVETNGAHIIRSAQLKRADRELLLRAKWLVEIIKGWYLLVTPNLSDGESSPWYASFWDFARLYLENRFGSDYCLSAESSLDLHTKSSIIPKQVIVLCKKGGGGCSLPFDTSIFSYVDKSNIPEKSVSIDGLQAMPLGLALCRVSKAYFEKSPNEARIALSLLKTSKEITDPVLKDNLQAGAARVLGALHELGRTSLVKRIYEDLQLFGYDLKASNPFETKVLPVPIKSCAHALRIQSMWADMRGDIIQVFPLPESGFEDVHQVLEKIEELYQEDAYNSLSIEGYQVNETLIAKVHNNEWNPNRDTAETNALAARGYYEAFQEVKQSIIGMQQRPQGDVIESDLQTWYQSLFAPSARAGILPKTDLLGYREHQVFIRSSRHVSFPHEVLIDAMEAYFECLKNEEHPAVRAILGHYIFVFIHPYMDGNGRLGRFITNALFAGSGYPWTIVHVENRTPYLESLETAGVEGNIKPFAKFIASEQKKSFDIK